MSRTSFSILCSILAFILLISPMVEVYRNVQTHTPAVVVHVPNGEVGYSAGWFYCHSGEC